MRKIKLLSLAATAALCTIACQKNELGTVSEENGTTGIATDFTGTTENVSKAYVAYDSGVYRVKWAKADQLIITDGAKTGTFGVASFDVTKTDFTLVDGEVPASAPFTAYYPASAYSEGTFTIPSTQTYKEDGIGVFPIVGKNSTHDLVFESVLSVLKVNVKPFGNIKVKRLTVTSATKPLCGAAAIDFSAADEYGQYKINTVTIAPEGSKSITLDCGDGIAISAGSSIPFMVALPADTYPAEDLSVTVTTTDGKSETRTYPAAATLSRSKIHAATKDIPVDFVWDYCYGEANTIIAYNKTSVDIDITPYAIVNNTLKKIEGVTAAPKPAKAELVWREEGLTIADSDAIVLDNENHKVTVALSGTGNALIAIKDASDKILWSYQIWKPDYDVENNLKTYNGYQVLPLAIGAVNVATLASTAEEKALACGSLYQFGRKDPLGRCNSSTPTDVNRGYVKTYSSFDDSQLVDFDNLTKTDAGTWGGVADQFKAAQTWATQNPTILVYGAKGSYDDKGLTNGKSGWLPNCDNTLNAWGNKARNVATAYKTVYDPCPKGYKVPMTEKVFAGLSTSNGSHNAEAHDGWQFTPAAGGVDFFPACSYRPTGADYAGKLLTTNTSGTCRGSSPKDDTYGWCSGFTFAMNVTTVDPSYKNNWFTNAFSVRCVKE